MRLSIKGVLVAAVYLLVIFMLALLCFMPGADRPAAHLTLWLITLPTSLLLGPFYVMAAAAVDGVLGDAIWVFHIVWWCLVGLAEVGAVAAASRMAAVCWHRGGKQ